VPSAVGFARWSTLRHARRTTTQYTLQTSRSFRRRTRNSCALRASRRVLFVFSLVVLIFRSGIARPSLAHSSERRNTSGAANRHRNVLICEASMREKINGSKRRIHELLVCESCLHAVALPTGFDGFTSLALFSLFPSSLSIDTHTSLTFRRTTIVQIPSKRPTKTHPHNAASHAQDKQPSFGMLPFFV